MPGRQAAGGSGRRTETYWPGRKCGKAAGAAEGGGAREWGMAELWLLTVLLTMLLTVLVVLVVVVVVVVVVVLARLTWLLLLGILRPVRRARRRPVRPRRLWSLVTLLDRWLLVLGRAGRGFGRASELEAWAEGIEETEGAEGTEGVEVGTR